MPKGGAGPSERSIQGDGRESWMLWTTECYEAPTSGVPDTRSWQQERETMQDGVAEANPHAAHRGERSRGRWKAKGHGAGHHLGTHGTSRRSAERSNPHFPEGR